MAKTTDERRAFTGTIEFRADGDTDGPVAEGYAAVFGRRSVDLGGFTELIDPAAFNKTITEADVVALWDHRDEHLLGRVSSGTLRLSVDERGLRYAVDLPDTTTGRDVQELLRRGDVTGSSFGFRTIRDEWHEGDDGAVTRTLLEVALIDVSPVARPAYPDADVALRSFAATVGRDLADVRRAAEARALGSLISPQGGDEHREDKDEGRPPTAPFRAPLTSLLA